jgi:hypothetical protein
VRCLRKAAFTPTTWCPPIRIIAGALAAGQAASGRVASLERELAASSALAAALQQQCTALGWRPATADAGTNCGRAGCAAPSCDAGTQAGHPQHPTWRVDVGCQSTAGSDSLVAAAQAAAAVAALRQRLQAAEASLDAVQQEASAAQGRQAALAAELGDADEQLARYREQGAVHEAQLAVQVVGREWQTADEPEVFRIAANTHTASSSQSACACHRCHSRCPTSSHHSSQDSELQQLRTAVAVASTAVAHSLEERSDVIDKRDETITQQERAIQELTERLADAVCQETLLHQQVQSSKAQAGTAQAQRDAALEQVTSVQARCAAAEDRLCTAEQRCQTAEAAAASLGEQLRASAVQAESSLKAAAKEHAVQATALQQDLEAVRRHLAVERETVGALHRQLLEAQISVETLEVELQACKLEQCAQRLDEGSAALVAAASSACTSTGHNDVHPAPGQNNNHLALDMAALQEELAAVRRRAAQLGAREVDYAQAAAAARMDLAACERQCEDLRSVNVALARDLSAATEQLAACGSGSAPSASVSASDEVSSVASLGTATTATQRVDHLPSVTEEGNQHRVVVTLLADNRNLLAKLQRTHAKLKLAKARVLELEAIGQVGGLDNHSGFRPMKVASSAAFTMLMSYSVTKRLNAECCPLWCRVVNKGRATTGTRPIQRMKASRARELNASAQSMLLARAHGKVTGACTRVFGCLIECRGRTNP